jgi:hypothetical protein
MIEQPRISAFDVLGPGALVRPAETRLARRRAEIWSTELAVLRPMPVVPVPIVVPAHSSERPRSAPCTTPQGAIIKASKKEERYSYLNSL